MIIDTLSHLATYRKLNPLFDKVVEFLRTHNLEEMPTGSHPIKGNEVYVNIQEQEGKTKSQAVLEAHRQMIDIQLPISGVETYGVTPLNTLPEIVFDEANDCALWHDIAPQNFVTCNPGMFVVFFPQDAHAPLISSEKLLKKAVFKIKA